MSFFNLLAIAIALAMDAFAVAIATGISLKQISFRQTFRLSFHFGLFQALMPMIGWGVGLTFRGVIEHYDHWVAFVLLGLIGGNMIREAFQRDAEDANHKEATRGMTLVILSVATSIDALAVGFSMSVLSISIIFPAVIIGIIAALFTIVGLHLGKIISASSKISHYSELWGGLVLLGIGMKILYEHGVFT
jgi:putative Mn2+ efflux pump MntP